ncbi:MAG: S-layer homology domain-containing protein [Butyricicoccus sp.]
MHRSLRSSGAWRIRLRQTVRIISLTFRQTATTKDAVQWAVDNNITTGTSATTFAPNAGCTRGQIVTFLYRQLGK